MVGINASALTVRDCWLTAILGGQKSLEVRKYPTKLRGIIGLIKAGDSQIYVTVSIVSCRWYTFEELKGLEKAHRIPEESLQTFCGTSGAYAWELQCPRPIPGIRIARKPGSVNWVRLDKGAKKKLEDATSKQHRRRVKGKQGDGCSMLTPAKRTFNEDPSSQVPGPDPLPQVADSQACPAEKLAVAIASRRQMQTRNPSGTSVPSTECQECHVPKSDRRMWYVDRVTGKVMGTRCISCKRLRWLARKAQRRSSVVCSGVDVD